MKSQFKLGESMKNQFEWVEPMKNQIEWGNTPKERGKNFLDSLDKVNFSKKKGN